MKRKNLWWKQGRIGRFLEALKEDNSAINIVLREDHWLIVEGGKNYIHLTLRGNSKQRRQQRRAILRYINGE